MDAGAARSLEGDEAAVRAVEEAYDSAWDAGDIGAILELLTEDVAITNPYGETTTGRDEVERFFATLFSGVANSRRPAGASAEGGEADAFEGRSGEDWHRYKLSVTRWIRSRPHR